MGDMCGLSEIHIETISVSHIYEQLNTHIKHERGGVRRKRKGAHFNHIVQPELVMDNAETSLGEVEDSYGFRNAEAREDSQD